MDQWSQDGVCDWIGRFVLVCCLEGAESESLILPKISQTLLRLRWY